MRDIPASIAWYGRILGTTCTITMGDPPAFALLDRADEHLLGLAFDPDVRPALFAAVYLNVTGVDAAYGHCVAVGAEVLGPPQTHLWGQRDFVVVHADGHQIAVGEHVGS